MRGYLYYPGATYTRPPRAHGVCELRETPTQYVVVSAQIVGDNPHNIRINGVVGQRFRKKNLSRIPGGTWGGWRLSAVDKP